MPYTYLSKSAENSAKPPTHVREICGIAIGGTWPLCTIRSDENVRYGKASLAQDPKRKRPNIPPKPPQRPPKPPGKPPTKPIDDPPAPPGEPPEPIDDPPKRPEKQKKPMWVLMQSHNRMTGTVPDMFAEIVSCNKSLFDY